ncbi:MAG: hypothetical protein JWL76_1998 [Thermoleophilia bacterium]|nr:hypothetical protein [Thermoleophilia bacterium]
MASLPSRTRAARARTRAIRACARTGRSAMLVLTLAALLGTGNGDAATSGSVVGANVLSATSLDVTTCSGSDLALGTAPPLTTVVTPTDCTVTFGSSNDSSALRLMQADQRGSALTQYASPITTYQAAPQLEGVTLKSTTEGWLTGLPRKTGDPTPVARTTDGGATWTAQTPCTGASQLFDIEHVTANTVVAVGTGNVVCRTTDGGSLWSRITPAPSGVWRTVEMLPSGQGWMGGNAGRLATTVDGGATWTALPVPDSTWTIFDISAASATRLYAVASDTGSPNNVLALTSSDGGTSWSSYVIGNTQVGGWGSSSVALSTTTALVGTSYGTWRTTNTGATWTLVDVQGTTCLASPDGATVISSYVGTLGLRRSTDGGATWASLPTQPTTTGQLRGCDAFGTTALLVGVNDQRLYSSDTGQTYSVAPSTYRDQNAVAAWTGDRFVTVGALGSVRRTVDGGTTITQPSSGTSVELYDVETFDNDVAVAVGASGTIRRSTDGGATWTGITSGTGVTLTSIDRGPGGVTYAVGASGVVLRSTDDGLTWPATTPAGATSLWAVVALSATEAWIGGSGGAIYRTTNGGTSWTSQTSNTTLTVHALDSLDGVTAIATTVPNASNQSGTLRTTDSGSTWAVTMTPGPSLTELNDVRFLDATTVVVASDGAYRRSTDSGATWSVVTTILGSISGIAPLDVNSFVFAGLSDAIARVLPTDSYGDYALTTRDFAGTSSTFGACMLTATGTTSTDWTPAGVGNCTAVNLGAWQPVSADSTTSRIARRATSGTASVDLRFGAKAGNTQKPGAYVAQLRFEVIAPG